MLVSKTSSKHAGAGRPCYQLQGCPVWPLPLCSWVFFDQCEDLRLWQDCAHIGVETRVFRDRLRAGPRGVLHFNPQDMERDMTMDAVARFESANVCKCISSIQFSICSKIWSERYWEATWFWLSLTKRYQMTLESPVLWIFWTHPWSQSLRRIEMH